MKDFIVYKLNSYKLSNYAKLIYSDETSKEVHRIEFNKITNPMHAINFAKFLAEVSLTSIQGTEDGSLICTFD